ncbi:hypothetical protein BS78_K058800 [Paspalum vaginatum]|uniref:Uncharacterized protein n=1 Tax=Paspalum vaginatum TaxID=158149 RepID=A0A9W8CE74_9POAL|nr:hypothetical protein BS78_K058800 [Paspalum vaginatum]
MRISLAGSPSVSPQPAMVHLHRGSASRPSHGRSTEPCGTQVDHASHPSPPASLHISSAPPPGVALPF